MVMDRSVRVRWHGGTWIIALGGLVTQLLGGVPAQMVAAEAGAAKTGAETGAKTSPAKGTAKAGAETGAKASTPKATKVDVDRSAAKAAPAGGSSPSDKAAAVAGPLAAVVAKVQGAYSKLETLHAGFEQSSKMASSSKPRVDTGIVEFKKGGMMRWDFEKPEPRAFISDGKTLWIYSPKDKQVIQSDLRSGASQTALNFMAGLGDLGRDFTPALATEPEYQRPGMNALHLTPKEAIGTLKRLTIVVSEADGLVREAYVADQMGSTTRIAFSDLKVNTPIADSRFSFKAPAGVDVVQPQGF
jgi:outer membrane lipoprotein carrier protein